MKTMSNTAMGIILVCYTVILILLVVVNHFINKSVKTAIKLADNMAQNASDTVDTIAAFERRDKEIAKLFSQVLFDLSHAVDKNALMWKLMIIRQIEFIMDKTGYENVYDPDFYEWLKNVLTKVPQNAQFEILRKFRDAVKGYYIMDPDVGISICDMLNDIINQNADAKGFETKAKESYKALLTSISDADLELLVADCARHDGTVDAKQSLFDALRDLQQVCEDAHKIVLDFEEKGAKPDDEFQGEVREDNPDKTPQDTGDEIPGDASPSVQGEETEGGMEETSDAQETKISGVEMTSEPDGHTGVEVIAGNKNP